MLRRPRGKFYRGAVVAGGICGGNVQLPVWLIHGFGFTVHTDLDFSGAGDSEGRTSWTAKPELADYVSFYGFMLLYLHALKLGVEPNQDSGNSSGSIHLVLGGYSYGSMIASHLPATDVVVSLFRQAVSGTAPYEICKIAEELAGHSEERLHLPQSPTVDKSSPTIDEGGLEEISRSTVSYLLVSPILPPLSNLLTLFSKLSLDVGVDMPAQGKQIPCPKPATQLCQHRSLALYGNEDGFTSAKKLRTWSGELSSVPQSQFQCREIDGAGHFWREDGVANQARHVLQDWLDGMS